jgi:hypothetical protein
MPDSDDPLINAARYIVDRTAKERGEQTPTEASHERDHLRAKTTPPTSADRAVFVESVIQQAIRRGDFDNLPGAGKPLTGLTAVHDPDWWIRRKIEREQLTGLGPPALTLRVESRSLDERLDGFTREDDVRAVLEDFNLRIVEARRQLQGGPPVVTPTRDVDVEVERWKQRRPIRRSSSAAHSATRVEAKPPWYRRLFRPAPR